MKNEMHQKIGRRVLAALLAATLLLGGFGCAGSRTLSRLRRELGVDVSKGTVLVGEDDHNGAGSSGTAFTAAAFDPGAAGALTKKLASDGRWNELPLTDTLSRAVYGDAEHEPLTTMGGEKAIPEVKNGYYRFIDRYKGAQDASDDSFLFTRTDYNFTIALYDTDANVLYYYKLDL